jgi:hypothetical protein
MALRIAGKLYFCVLREADWRAKVRRVELRAVLIAS